jgi:hypothetical protein
MIGSTMIRCRLMHRTLSVNRMIQNATSCICYAYTTINYNTPETHQKASVHHKPTRTQHYSPDLPQ